MPIKIPDNLKEHNAEAAKAMFFRHLNQGNGLDMNEALKIAEWMTDAYMAGWSAGVKQSIDILRHLA